MKYPKTPNNDRYVIETMHGCYSDCGWCYNSTKNSLEEAKDFIQKWGSEYRIYDSKIDEVLET